MKKIKKSLVVMLGLAFPFSAWGQVEKPSSKGYLNFETSYTFVDKTEPAKFMAVEKSLFNSTSSLVNKLVPDYWANSPSTLNFTSGTAGSVPVITDDIIKLAGNSEIDALVDFRSRANLQETMKTFPLGMQKIIKANLDRLRFGNSADMSSPDKNQRAIFREASYSPEQKTELNAVLEEEKAAYNRISILKNGGDKNWNQVSRFSVDGLTTELQLEVKLKNGQKIYLFGSADEVIDQFNKKISVLNETSIASYRLIKVNRQKLEALYGLFAKDGGRALYLPGRGKEPEYTNFRNSVQNYNLKQSPSISLATKFFGSKKTVGKIGLGVIAAGAAAAAIASEASVQAEQAVKATNGTTPSKLKAPKIEANGSR